MTRLLTTDQPTEVLRISRNHLYRLVWAGEIEPVKLGRASRWRVEDVERLVRCGAKVARRAPRGERAATQPAERERAERERT